MPRSWPGKEAVFKCKVHKVEETILPEMDDEFAKDVSDTCETLDDLKKGDQRPPEGAASGSGRARF